MPSPNRLKRTYDDTGLDGALQSGHGTPTAGIPQSSPQLSLCSGIDPQSRSQLPTSRSGQSRDCSPLPSTMSATAAVTSTHMTSAPSTSTVDLPKKRKLTPAEREAKRVEKEAKDRQKAEEKAQKDEEKRIKDAEMEEKRKSKETQKQQKEDEKKKKEDEKTKKERSQLRLNAFFALPSLPTDESPKSPTKEGISSTGSRRSSITSIDGLAPYSRSRSTSVAPPKCPQIDYERSFPPFYLQKYTVLAPFNRFTRDEESLKYVQSKMDQEIGGENEMKKHCYERMNIFDLCPLLYIPTHKRRRNPPGHCTVKDVMARMHGTICNSIDLTVKRSCDALSRPADLLKSISSKYLRFAEDVRPPYIGTYTKLPAACSTSKLCRRPFARTLPQMNYDYDSEAEWEEPGEGEDLDSEGEEELGEDEEADEMEGFLDDEDAGDGIGSAMKRRPVMGELEPSCTGLCWDSINSGCNTSIHDYREGTLDLRAYKLEILLDPPETPIDPYSTAYWPSTNTTRSIDAPPSTLAPTSMNPPRIPLSAINRTNSLILSPSTLKSTILSVTPHSTVPKPPKRLVAPDLLDAFKAAVQGSDLTKAGLVEILKKQFPKTSKDAIKDTLGLIAERVGAKEAEKRWVLKPEHGG